MVNVVKLKTALLVMYILRNWLGVLNAPVLTGKLHTYGLYKCLLCTGAVCHSLFILYACRQFHIATVICTWHRIFLLSFFPKEYST